MAKGLRIAEPPPRRPVMEAGAIESAPAPAPIGEKFNQIREKDRVQFNKRVSRGVADGFEMLAIRTRRKVPELLTEALELLQERYGRV
jgi:hypothetical protein